ncbi:MAG: hypothetical protein ABI444_11010 [Candidatus Kapaibacterium sp.]|jgi:hypothetical protein
MIRDCFDTGHLEAVPAATTVALAKVLAPRSEWYALLVIVTGVMIMYPSLR